MLSIKPSEQTAKATRPFDAIVVYALQRNMGENQTRVNDTCHLLAPALPIDKQGAVHTSPRAGTSGGRGFVQRAGPVLGARVLATLDKPRLQVGVVQGKGGAQL